MRTNDFVFVALGEKLTDADEIYNKALKRNIIKDNHIGAFCPMIHPDVKRLNHARC